jgi:hypothetical protein
MRTEPRGAALLEKGDEQRSVKRESVYANFEIDRQERILGNLAYVLTISFNVPSTARKT